MAANYGRGRGERQTTATHIRIPLRNGATGGKAAAFSGKSACICSAAAGDTADNAASQGRIGERRMSIRDWPPGERPREKLLAQGATSLSEAELLALLLRTGTAGRSALDIARALLVEFGSLRGLLSADRERACRARGLGPTRYAVLQASLELTRRHYQELMMTGSALANPRATRDFLRMRLRDLPHEVFCCVYLDNRHRVIAFEELFRGTIDGASVHPREVVKQALARNAAAVILVHNHPSGLAEPSQADELITRRLKEALGLVDIRVLDHLVVGDAVCESFAERGLL
jgi:DNA repair protein RadC